MSPGVVAAPQIEVLATSTAACGEGLRASEASACAGGPGGATIGSMVASIRLR